MQKYVGINIQYPISRLIIEGKKSIETRTYPIPKDYIGKKMLVIETPGKSNLFKAQIIGVIEFGESFKYKSEDTFYRDQKKHLVTKNSPWRWITDKPKWGWPILSITAIKPILAPKKKGIIYTKDIKLSSKNTP